MELFNYQKEIFLRIKDKDSYALFMEAGTGKTVLSQYWWEQTQSKKLLIVCLASKVNEWLHDCTTFFGDKYDICVLNKGKETNKQLVQEQFDIFIISFQSLLLLGASVKINNDWAIIIDESQIIKNHKSKISKLLHNHGSKTRYKLILTGTPQNKGYIDYYSQLKFLGVFGTLKSFQDNFCEMKQVRYGAGVCFYDIGGYKNTDVLDKIINNNAVYFKRDRTVSELPDQKYINFKKNSKYNQFIKDRVYEDIACTTPATLRLRCRQICGGNIHEHVFDTEKTQWMSDFIENTFARIVIFYNFDAECKLLTEIVKKAHRPIAYYNGKYKDVKNFDKHDNCVILVNYASGGTGINWLRAAYIGVFWSPPESYMVFEQARKRLDRIGQKKIPMFYCLRTLNTVEQEIYNSIEKKEDFDNLKFQNHIERITNEEII